VRPLLQGGFKQHLDFFPAERVDFLFRLVLAALLSFPIRAAGFRAPGMSSSIAWLYIPRTGAMMFLMVDCAHVSFLALINSRMSVRFTSRKGLSPRVGKTWFRSTASYSWYVLSLTEPFATFSSHHAPYSLNVRVSTASSMFSPFRISESRS
jgi:hypothetical protein